MARISIPRFLKPRLRLFLSVDLVGSTRLKQGAGFPIQDQDHEGSWFKVGPQWFPPIAEFYRSLEHEFSTLWHEYSSSEIATEFAPGDPPELWKAMGDELVYEKILSEPYQVAFCCAIWVKAVDRFRKTLKEKYPPELDVKCAAWTAGFPIGNSEIVFQRNVSGRNQFEEYEDPRFQHYYLLDEWYRGKNRNGLAKDYAGPSIDIGFRLGSLSTPRKFIVSLEVALMIASIQIPKTKMQKLKLRRPDILYDGMAELKGVDPYPVFWVDTRFVNSEPQRQASVSEDDLLRPLDRSSVHDFCHEFFDATDDKRLRPFIQGCSVQEFSTPPDNFDANIKAMAKKWADEKRRIETQLKAASGKSFPGRQKAGGETAPSSGTVNEFVQTLSDDENIASTPRSRSRPTRGKTKQKRTRK